MLSYVLSAVLLLLVLAAFAAAIHNTVTRIKNGGCSGCPGCHAKDGCNKKQNN